MVEPGAGLTTYTYYDDGRISNERVAADGSMQWLYDEAGKMRRLQVMDYRVTYVHDEADRMTRLTSFHRTLLVTMTDFKYAYDKVGNRTRVVDLDNERTTWTYDKAYRLTREQRVGTTATYDHTYRYDAAGNRTLKVAGAARTTSTYNAGNQLLTYKESTGTTTFTYDDTGNRRTKKDASGTTTYAWDYENRLTSVRLPAGTRNTFTYNADGQRVKVERPSETRKQIWDELRIIQETDNSDVVQTQYRQEPAGFGNLLSQRRGTHRDVLHYDALGTTSKVTFHNTTEVRARYWSDAWGNVLATSGSPTVTPMRFVGRLGYYRDDDTGLYLMSARPYDPVTSQFLSQDPLGFIDGPNRYVYVANNPVNAVDPSGLQGIPQQLQQQIRGPWVDVISWLANIPNGDPVYNWVTNSEPPNKFKPAPGAFWTIGGWLSLKEFRNHHFVRLSVCCKAGRVISVDEQLGQNPGYTPLRLHITFYAKGQAGVRDLWHSKTGQPCYTIQTKVRFRVAWPENIGQALINWHLFPWSWSTLSYTICCDGSVELAYGGSFIPCHKLFVDGKQLGFTCTNDWGNQRALQILREFKKTGGGNDAPGQDNFGDEKESFEFSKKKCGC